MDAKNASPVWRQKVPGKTSGVAFIMKQNEDYACPHTEGTGFTVEEIL